MYSSSPLYFIISGAIKPSVPPKPLVPEGKVNLLMPKNNNNNKRNIFDEHLKHKIKMTLEKNKVDTTHANKQP